MARVIFGTKLREKDCFTRRGPGCTICHTQEDQSKPPWVLRRFWVDVYPKHPPRASHIAGSGQKTRAYRGNCWQKSFLIHCTRHFIRNLFFFFFLFSSKTHWMSTLGSCWYRFMVIVFKLLILHSGLETSENINSVCFHLQNLDGEPSKPPNIFQDGEKTLHLPSAGV